MFAVNIENIYRQDIKGSEALQHLYHTDFRHISTLHPKPKAIKLHDLKSG